MFPTPTWIRGLCWAALCLGPIAANAARPALNDTGMRQCMTAAGRYTTQCAGTGQDGETGRDVTAPLSSDGVLGFSFAKVCHSGQRAGQGSCPADPAQGSGADDWGCTRDLVTGLTWELKTDDGGPLDADLAFNHEGSGLPDDVGSHVAHLNTVALCGATDWRLPATVELQTLAHHGAPSGGGGFAIDTRAFPNVRDLPHWAAELLSYDPRNAFRVSFSNGSVGFAGKTASYPVMAVRGGARLPGARFQAGGEEVLDRLTGLIWRRCPLGQSILAGACTGVATWYDWAGALTAARNEATASGKAWRLPNIKELGSLMDLRVHDPAVDHTAFPWGEAQGLWSSTPAAEWPQQVWVHDAKYGSSYVDSRSTVFPKALLVRAAP